MDPWVSTLIVVAGVGIGLWLLSFVAEALRPIPKTPATLRWAPDIPVNYVEVDGAKLRYIKTGAGPVVVLLHTLRTQLDLFEKVVPELSKRFSVYAVDYPGHGYSEIPNARYDAAFFTKAVEGFLDRLDLREITLVGVSIGGVIPLIIAARRNPRVARVIAINPYDYAKGRGMARSSVLGWLITYASFVPVIGETVNRLRNFVIMKAVLRGGVATPRASPLRSCRRCMPWAIAEGTTAPSSICSATERVGSRNKRLRPHRYARLARLGRPGLGATFRAPAHALAHRRCRNENRRAGRSLPTARSPR